MATGKQIIVKKGGALWIDGGTISHISKYNGNDLPTTYPENLWYGIKVEGTQGLPNGYTYLPSEYWQIWKNNNGRSDCIQDFPTSMTNCPFGTLQMKNAKLEYAFNTVTSGDWDMTHKWMIVPQTGGARLHIKQSEFFNNWGWCLGFSGYDKINLSQIDSNLFHSDMAVPNFVPRTLRSTNNTVQIAVFSLSDKKKTLRDNIFKINQTPLVYGQAKGILIFDGTFNIWGSNTNITHFEKLNINIEQYVSNLKEDALISNLKFTDTWVGVQMYASDFLRVNQCVFEHPSGLPNSNHFDIAIRGTDGFFVHDNIFDAMIPRNTSYPSSSALTVFGSGSFGNEINNNLFTDYPQGASCFGNNTGLAFRCNNFVNQNGDDILVASGAIRPNQGYCDVITQTFDPAGNTFSHICNHAESDLHQHANASNLNYFFHDNEDPDCYSTSSVSTKDCNAISGVLQGTPFECSPRLLPIAVPEVIEQIDHINYKIDVLEHEPFPDLTIKNGIDYLTKERQLLENSLLLTWGREDKDDAIIRYLQDRTDWYAQWRLINFYMEIDQHENAQNQAMMAKLIFAEDTSVHILCDFAMAASIIKQANFDPMVNAALTPELLRIASYEGIAGTRARVLLDIIDAYQTDHTDYVAYKVSPTDQPSKNTSLALNWGAYPNPVKEVLTLYFQNSTLQNQTVDVQLTDIMGNRLLSKHFGLTKGSKTYHTLRLDQEKIRQGIYYLQVYQDQHLIGTQRIYKK